MFIPDILVSILQQVIDGVFLGLFYAVVASGLALVFGVMDIINFAHGDLIMISAYFIWLVSIALNIDPLVSTILLIPLLFLLGLGVQKGLINPVLGREPLIQIAVTVGFGFILQNIALGYFKAEPRGYPNPVFSGGFSIGPFVIYESKLVSAVLSLVILWLLNYFLTRTRIGLAMRAVTDDRASAMLMGINVDRIYLLTFGLGMVLIGIAAGLWMEMGQVWPYLGSSFSLVSWVAVALAGLGSVQGLVYSGLIIGIAESLGSLISPSVKMAVVYLIFFLILWFRPRGLFARR
ncbi:branched-chain amino acid ABC transporter permease [Thermogladius sp. 4427co]|uniref:branched-chain amino acid ABC transporter permease n=1 Tax=Thermogladius sp. 4427co TaxID=3450718 RepID=UPI003F796242